jgi:hypothetical protein
VRRESPVVTMQFGRESFTRDSVVEILRKAGYAEIAERAARELPDQIDRAELDKWAAPNGLTIDELISRMGGSP